MPIRVSVATATSAPNAGWYPDPHGSDDHLRWWDGAVWTSYTTDTREPDPPPGAVYRFADTIVDVAAGEVVPYDDDIFGDLEPIQFSWSDPSDLFEVTIAEAPGESDVLAFRPDPVESRRVELEIEVPTLPVYESPVATISSPVSVRVEIPVRVDPPLLVEAPRTHGPGPVGVSATPSAPPVAAPRRRIAIAGTGAAIAVAAAAAIATNVVTGNDTPERAKPAVAGPSLSIAARGCMKEWNTTASGGAAQLRVTLGQFAGALAKVGRVQPLPGTVIAPNSCALTVYDPSSDTHAIFVSGVKDQVGYQDVTAYPRTSSYGWPKTGGQANVTIRPDGSLRSL